MEKREENSLTYLTVCLLSLKAILYVFALSFAFAALRKTPKQNNPPKSIEVCASKKLEVMMMI